MTGLWGALPRPRPYVMGAGERSELSNRVEGLVVIVPDKAESSPEEAGCMKPGELYSLLNDVAPVRCTECQGRKRDGDIARVSWVYFPIGQM